MSNKATLERDERKETRGLRLTPSLLQQYRDRARRATKQLGFKVTPSALMRKALERDLEVNP